MREEMAAFISQFYGLSEATAAEVVAEMRDTRSLQNLAGYRAARAVPTSTPPPKA